MTAAAASSLSLPPLMRAEAAPAGADPLHVAAARAEDGCDPGLILHNDGGERLSAALVLAPEAPLEDAMAMVFAASLGLSDAIGALGPPETAFHFVWPGGFRLNGAACGEARAAASTH
ncbi:MAG: biotin/lipoate--protein ligase family protein, partial [Pseudomonadota bacterium]